MLRRFRACGWRTDFFDGGLTNNKKVRFRSTKAQNISYNSMLQPQLWALKPSSLSVGHFLAVSDICNLRATRCHNVLEWFGAGLLSKLGSTASEFGASRAFALSLQRLENANRQRHRGPEKASCTPVFRANQSFLQAHFLTSRTLNPEPQALNPKP